MKPLIYILIISILFSCSPQREIIGVGMRKVNTSQNKYTKKKPYIKNGTDNNKQ